MEIDEQHLAKRQKTTYSESGDVSDSEHERQNESITEDYDSQSESEGESESSDEDKDDSSDYVQTESDSDSDSDSDSELVPEEEEDEAGNDEEYLSDVLSDSDSEEDLLQNIPTEIRSNWMDEKNKLYQTFGAFTVTDVKVALRFIRNVSDILFQVTETMHPHLFSFDMAKPCYDKLAGIFDPTMIDDTKVVFDLQQKLYKLYDISKLPESGGIPLAYHRSFTVTFLFATLLAHVVPKSLRETQEMVKHLRPDIQDPLIERKTFDYDDSSSEQIIEKIWEHIEMECLAKENAERFIKRCVGGAVACIIKFKNKIKDEFQKAFEVRVRKSGVGATVITKEYRILGASRNAPKSDDESRLLIQMYPKEATQPTFIRAHVHKDLEMKDLLETLADKHPDVKRELKDRDFTLVFTTTEGGGFLDPGISATNSEHLAMSAVTVPPDYKFPASKRTLTMVCAVENLEVNNRPHECTFFNRHSFRKGLESEKLEIHVRSHSSEFNWPQTEARIDSDTSIDDLLKKDDGGLLRQKCGLSITCYIPCSIRKFKRFRKTYNIYQAPKNPKKDASNDELEKINPNKLEKRIESLRTKLTRSLEHVSNLIETNLPGSTSNVVPYPANDSGQFFIHAFPGAKVMFHPSTFTQSDLDKIIVKNFRTTAYKEVIHEAPVMK